MQSGIFPADLVYSCDHLGEVVWTIKFPLPNLILFRVQILFTAVLSCLVCTEFTRDAIDPIMEVSVFRQNEAEREGSATAELQILGEDIGRVFGHRFGRKPSRTSL